MAIYDRKKGGGLFNWICCDYSNMKESFDHVYSLAAETAGDS